MKTFTLVSFLAAAFSATIACAATPSTTATPAPTTTTTVTTSATGEQTSTTVNGFTADKYTLKVKGMTCQSCANSVENAIEAVPGVKEANASFKSGVVKVVSSGPSKLDKDAVIKAIEKAGYTVQE